MEEVIYDGLRGLNVLIALLAFMRLLETRVRKWKSFYTEKEKILWFALMGATITGGEGALENILQDNQGGPRVICTFVYLIFTLWGAYMPDKPRKVQR